MIVLIHVVIALSSVACAGFAAISPSRWRIHISYVLIASTLASGTYLVISTGSPLLSSCTTGLVYLAIVSSGLLAARRRLAMQINVRED